jgi:hypothetical protein
MQQFIFNRPNNDNNINTTNELKHNLMVMEITNNWPFVRWLIYRIEENMVDKIDTVENDWLNFIRQHNINIESYENAEVFMEKHLKPLANEN